MYAKNKEIWRQGHLGNLDLNHFTMERTQNCVKIVTIAVLHVCII